MAGGTVLGTGYVQIEPTSKGIGSKISSMLNSEVGGTGESTGTKWGGKFKVAALAACAAIGTGIAKSISEGSALEQSLGGVETLYGTHANKVIANANKAWKTAGLSANQYMEQSTTFAASLLSSLGGDTQKAASYADMAITDMADNANKMGTSIEDIQNAYQGFSKQNYTMLDNLKLGYGGTKTEMERLLSDAEKLTGQKYDISNLNDIYDAIHAVQGELGITGTTAKEAEETLSGSLNSMKSAWSNLLGDMSMRPELVTQDMQNLVTSATTFFFGNLVPALGNVFKSLPTAIGTFINQGIPQIMTAAQGLMNSLVEGMSGSGDMINKIMPMLTKLSQYLLDNSSQLISTGLQMMVKLAQGIAQGLPSIISNIPAIITNIANIVNTNMPKILATGVKIIITLAKGLIQAIPTLIANIPKIIQAIFTAWSAFNWLSLGKTIITGIKTALVGSGGTEAAAGVGGLVGKIKTAVTTKFTAIVAAIKAKAASIWGAITSPFRIAISKVSGAVGSIKAAVSSKLSAIVGAIKGKAGSILSNFTRPFTSAWTKIKAVVGKIKGFFPLHLGKIFSGLKIPHISVSGGKAPFGIGGKGTLPKFKVTWNADGGIFNSASIMGYGVGEAGSEAIVPLDPFWNKIDAMIDTVTSAKNSATGGVVQLVINLDGETIGRSTVNYINGQTIQFGTSPVLV